MRAGMALLWVLGCAGCAKLGSPEGGAPSAVEGSMEPDGGASIDELPARDAAPIDNSPVASCAEKLERVPAAADGVYAIDRGDGPEEVYCDMSNGGVTYAELAFGNSFATYDGYSGATAADFAEPSIQQAFIYLFNRQGGGATNIAVGYNSNNCCFKTAGAAAGTMLTFGTYYLYPADVGADTANCNATYGAGAYRFMYGDQNLFPPASLPADYFQTNPPGEIVNCSDDNNPGWFFQRF